MCRYVSPFCLVHFLLNSDILETLSMRNWISFPWHNSSCAALQVQLRLYSARSAGGPGRGSAFLRASRLQYEQIWFHVREAAAEIPYTCLRTSTKTGVGQRKLIRFVHFFAPKRTSSETLCQHTFLSFFFFSFCCNLNLKKAAPLSRWPCWFRWVTHRCFWAEKQWRGEVAF